MKSCFSSSIVESISMIVTQHSRDGGSQNRTKCRFVKNQVRERVLNREMEREVIQPNIKDQSPISH